MSETFDLDREQNIQNNIDATGKKWEVHKTREKGFFYARPNPDRADAVIPKEMRGHWTKLDWLNKKIKDHVISTWDLADEAKAKSQRKAQAAKEAPKKEG